MVGGACIGMVVAVSVVLLWADAVPTVETLQVHRDALQQMVGGMPIASALIFAVLYTCVVALSLPFAGVLTILGGFLFGAIHGTLLVVVAATVGASCTFLAVRFFFGAYVTRRWGDRLALVNAELRRYGFRDILLLRLAPVVPFFLINAAAGLSQARLRDYVLATCIGIIPFTYVYARAGRELAEITSISDVVSFDTLITVSLVVGIACVPIILRRLCAPDDQQRARS